MNIKAAAIKTRDFVVAHPIETTFVIGCTVGAVATEFLRKKNPYYVCFMAKKSSLNKVVDEGGAIVFQPYKGHDYALVNSPF